MKFKKVLIPFLLILILTGCTNDSTSDLIDDTPIIENVTYSKNIKSIIDVNCLDCHASPPLFGAPMSLDTYEKVKQAINVRGLIGRITRENGQVGLMPYGGPRLPQDKIELIIKWQEQGLLE